MKIIDTHIPDVKILKPQVFTDARGYFFESFRQQWFQQHVANLDFVQTNQSQSIGGTLRGLHYQRMQPQGKLVRVMSGEIFDVAVDLRQSSPSFGHWTGHILSADNHCQMWIPPGFAHGFYVMSDSAECLYQCSDYYAPNDEYAIKWNDDTLAINWPLSSKHSLQLSEKDNQAGNFTDARMFD
ncbi:dTDP-4-dehydrorhamnose 3,5-epimerase [Shewanella sp. Isolate11]|uniref:dTDP-4-dehydrorhamnose 3,5-epimerase n=1 Tax=Shewanella sp. Isolate11 TaxID=2908530 RepID=UPI001EFC6FA9|nr:dTDP-4-dehydrorhamnose 3,5-epimerase [Shewanella sp. Isolate11]MCG9698298.1 dTDP-4-dehydrorhamnose 3,5-epimerase [Shewanella sp. Isolate11]